LLDDDDFIAQPLEGHRDIFRRSVIRQVLDNSFYLFVSFGVKGEEGETFLSEEFLCGFIVRNTWL
jgi:hypothetical protein